MFKVKEKVKEKEVEVSTEEKNILDELKTMFDGLIKSNLEAMAKTDKGIAGLYGTSGEEAEDVKCERLNKGMRELLERVNQSNVTLKADLTTGVTSPYGGYTVDSELVRRIEHLLTEFGVARKEMFLTPMRENSLVIPTQATDLSVAWVAEAGAITSTNPVFGKATLTTKKLVANVVISRELIEDTVVDLFGYLSERVAEGFAEAEDTQFFNGDGTVFTGVLQNTSTNNVAMATGSDSFEDMDADDLLDMQDATPQAGVRNGKYYMHRSVLNIVRKLKDSTTGKYIYQQPGEGIPGMIWDKPFVLVEAMPNVTDDDAASTAFVLFGDLKKAAWVGYRQEMLAERTNAVHWTTDLIDIKFTERVGYVAVLPTAVTRLTTGATS